MNRSWLPLTPPAETVGRLADGLGCTPRVAILLANRGLSDVETARRYLDGGFAELGSPDRLIDIDIAADRIARAIRSDEPILIFGDYDVDGVTATCLLCEFLSAAGARVTRYIPHRLREGYGFRPEHLENGRLPQETRLIITTDCGVSSHAAVENANARGIDVIVTDHHLPEASLPRALAVVNPNRPDCPSGFGHLAGVGVAFYLIIALRRSLREAGHWDHRPEPNLGNWCDLVALGTVADMVPLCDENRILTRVGLERIRQGGRPGLMALMRLAKLVDRPLGSDDISFRIAPLLNAAGRIEHADAALRLLEAATADDAERAAAVLETLNTQRQTIEREIAESIEDRLARSPELGKGAAVVLASKSWHLGVVGIVAARLARQLARPVMLFCVENGIARGSGRSVPGVDLVRGLAMCRESLSGFGGHAMAAGATLDAGHLDEFSERFCEALSAQADREPTPEAIQIDDRLDFSEIDPAFLEAIERLKPFGVGNPEPLFMADRVRYEQLRPVGTGHYRSILEQAGARGVRRLPAIHFNAPTDLPERCRGSVRIAYRVRWNHWNGNRTIQAFIEDVLPE